MRYQIGQKWLSWGDDFVIRDEIGNEVLQVDGSVFTLGSRLTIRDMLGNDVAEIKQRLLSWGPTYEIFRNGALAAVVKKELFTFFKCVFTVDVPGPDDLEAEGDFLDHEYTFTRGGFPVAAVSKEWFAWTDTYGVDVSNGQDDALILACSIVIDMVCHDGRD